MLYTDGAIEGHVTDSEDRLNVSGLAALADGLSGELLPSGDESQRVESQKVASGRFLDALIAKVTDLNGGPLTDDLALLYVGRS